MTRGCDHGGLSTNPDYGLQAGSMHPTRMLSCFEYYIRQVNRNCSFFSPGISSHPIQSGQQWRPGSTRGAENPRCHQRGGSGQLTS